MKSIYWSGVLIAAAVIVTVLLAANPVRAETTQFERLYGELLARYWHPAVRINGVETTVFDYARMKQDTQRPDSLFNRTLQAIEFVDPGQFKEENHVKAFWINAYNFAAMRLVADHYPVDSIRSLSISLIKYPWSKQAIRIGDKPYSLKQIEKDMLLKPFKDPRIVFAVSCAAVSCPDRTAEPFVAKRLDEQLDTMIRRFFKNPGKGLRLDRETRTLTLSWILKKDRHLFQENGQNVLGFVLPYLEPDVRSWLKVHTVTIDYFDHDWTLNDLAQAD